MKKLFLLTAFIASFWASAQDDLFIQNYTDTIIEYTIWKSNYTSTINCGPNIQANTSLSVLGPASSSPLGYVEAYYNQDVNTSNTYNPAYPDTPLINSWVVNADYLNPYNLPGNPVPTAFWMGSKWAGMKFGVKNTSGVAIGGYYTMHMGCGTANPPVLDLSGYGSPAVNGTIFTVGGSTFIVLF
ncbi:hypothetical protein [Chryseobacterium sp. G0201]|uniref:hypothetical protein n=1 Tax=Chryseobacterium sp. G0201 TaxID=2487065 RepID=UPI000F4FCCBE|nr:hypothetical protein [Chryseobacterium sp. G0201]AZA52748.1 hypothetical protein EG348_06885 [Chryseobacterium sp. G0201]